MGWVDLLRFSLLAAPQAYFSSSVPQCPSDAFEAALRAMHSRVEVVAQDPANEAWHVGVSVKDGAVVVLVSGRGHQATREFIDPNDCASTSQTVALIVDRELDDVNLGGAVGAATGFVSPNALVISLSAGGGLGQGTLGVEGRVLVEVGVRSGMLTLDLDGEWAPPSSSAIGGSTESFDAIGAALDLAGGLSLIAGPGRLGAAAVLGLEWSRVSASSEGLHQEHPGLATEAFVGLRAGYSVALPWQLFVAGRLEERYSPHQTAFGVEGETVTVTTPTWSAEFVLLLGRHFF